MLYEIPVLALNDDNHSTSYHTRTADYANGAAFMKECLCPAHLVDYKIRYIHICDLENDDLERLFEIVEGYIPATSAEKADAFNILWAIGTEDFYNA